MIIFVEKKLVFSVIFKNFTEMAKMMNLVFSVDFEKSFFFKIHEQAGKKA